jgi:hypothetical protein
LSARLFERNTVAQQVRVRTVLEAAIKPTPPNPERR